MTASSAASSAVVGDDHRHRLTDMPYLVPGEQRLPRIEYLVRHGGPPLAWQRKLLILDRWNFLRELEAAHHEVHPGCSRGARKIDRPDARMRHRAAHERDMQHVRQGEVGDVLAPAAQEPVILATGNRLPDETSVLVRANFHALHPSVAQVRNYT